MSGVVPVGPIALSNAGASETTPDARELDSGRDVVKRTDTRERNAVPSLGRTDHSIAANPRGAREATGTTGASPQRSPSSGWSSVVTMEPTPTRPSSDAHLWQTVATQPAPVRTPDRPVLPATVFAACLVAAILWVPRWVDARRAASDSLPIGDDAPSS